MEHSPTGDTNSRETQSGRDQSASACESIPATIRTTPSPDAAASNSLLSLSEAEGSVAGDAAHASPLSKCSSPLSAQCESIENKTLVQRLVDLSVFLKSESQADSRKTQKTQQSDLPVQGHPVVPVKTLPASQSSISLQHAHTARSCRTTVKRSRVCSVGRLLGEVVPNGQLGAPEGRTTIPPSSNDAKNDADLSPACAPPKTSWGTKGLEPRSGGGPAATSKIRDSSWHGTQLAPPAAGISSSQMVKSVSPAGVVRIGGRNRRKRTKYDLAYKQMEELGPFEEEAKSVDLSKVSGSSFALELLRNPQQYSYESWAYGFAWPVGADGRRLLLRKLRGVYWSDPEKWQRVLQENNLYRRDLFTLATVQELFKVTHLMGAEVWDFLLKCTALTQKCEALSSKDVDIGEDEETGVASPPGTAQPLGAEPCKSEDDLQVTSNQFFSDGLVPCPGFLRKRMACGVREEKDMTKRCRGRPRKSHFKVPGRSSGLGDHTSRAQTPTIIHPPPVHGSDASRWLSAMAQRHHTPGKSIPPLRPSLGDPLESRLISLDDQIRQRGTMQSPTNFSEGQRLVAALLRSAAPLRRENAYQAAPSVKPVTPGELGTSTNNMLKLTAHYTFMAQFMQCCMLVEVQRTLLKLAEEYKPSSSWSPSRDTSESPPKHDGKDSDPTARACFESLLESSNLHMQFVQVIVDQLHRHGDNQPVGDEVGKRATCGLSEEVEAALKQLHGQKAHFPSAPSETQRAAHTLRDGVQTIPSQCQISHCSNTPRAGQHATETRVSFEETGKSRSRESESLRDCEVNSDSSRAQYDKEVPAESRFDGLPRLQAINTE